MTALHHPSDSTLMAFAGRSLPPALELVAAAHLHLCEVCRRAGHVWNAFGGAYLESLPQPELSKEALSVALERLDSPAPVEAVPLMATSVLAGIDEKFRQSRWIGPSIRMASVIDDRTTDLRAYLLYAGAGRALPRHGHDGVEMTLVLRGRFSDNGVEYGPGDFQELDGTHAHSPVVSSDEACVCLIGSQGTPRLPGIAGWVVRQFM